MIEELAGMTVGNILLRLAGAALISGLIGYERLVHNKAIGVAGMMLVGIGSAMYMQLGIYLSASDPASISRTVQGVLQGIGFLGGAVIFKGGLDVRGIKTAAAIWITGGIGLAIGTWYWWLGIAVGIMTVIVLWGANAIPLREHLANNNSNSE